MAEETKPAKRDDRGSELVRRYAAPLAIVTALISFAVANRQRVGVDLLITTRDTRLIYVIVVSVGLGIALGHLAARRGRKKD